MQEKGRPVVSKCRDTYYLEGEVVKLLNTTYPACHRLIMLQVSMMFAPGGNGWKKSQATDACRMASPWPMALA